MASTLLLVPTQFEWQCFSKSFLAHLQQSDFAIELCGFGPIVSAIRTTQLIAQHSPKCVWLAGIAGLLYPQKSIGTAIEFDEAVCFGVGAGTGADFLSASEMGWSQWPAEPAISDAIRLNAKDNEPIKTLLTCCSASANEYDRQTRRAKHMSAIAEDMEGFAVAAACRFAGTPLRIVRGISNRAGDREKSNWRVEEAMASVEEYITKATTT